MDKQKIINALAQLGLEIELAYLFGSQATGRQTSSSDIDLAILPANKLDPKTCWLLAQRLSSQLGSEVDLINLMTCNTVLRYQVIEEGLLLLDPKGKAGFFETDTYRMYQDLQIKRHDNIKAFKQRWLDSKD